MERRTWLTIFTELAALEEGNRIWIVTANDEHNLHSENALRDDQLGHRFAVQYLVYGSCGFHRSSIHYCGHSFDRKCGAFASYWEEDHLPRVGVVNAGRSPMEHAYLLDLWLVHGQ